MISAEKIQLSESEPMKAKILFPLLVFVLLAGCSGTSHYLTAGETGVDVFVDLPKAKSVQFASSRDGFRWHAARKDNSGLWWIRVPGRGEFRYFYRVDGKLYVPDCTTREYDDFGRENCIYAK